MCVVQPHLRQALILSPPLPCIWNRNDYSCAPPCHVLPLRPAVAQGLSLLFTRCARAAVRLCEFVTAGLLQDLCAYCTWVDLVSHPAAPGTPASCAVAPAAVVFFVSEPGAGHAALDIFVPRCDPAFNCVCVRASEQIPLGGWHSQELPGQRCPLVGSASAHCCKCPQRRAGLHDNVAPLQGRVLHAGLRRTPVLLQGGLHAPCMHVVGRAVLCQGGGVSMPLQARTLTIPYLSTLCFATSGDGLPKQRA